MRCPGCGIEVSEDQTFCHDCGRWLTAPDAPTEATEIVVAAAVETETPTEQVDAVVPAPAAVADAWARPEATSRIDVTEPIPTAPAPGTSPAPVTAEMPVLFDGQGDLIEYPVPREPFRVRLIFLLSVFGVAAVLMTMVADVIDIRTTRPAAGIVVGPQMLDQLGGNLGLAGFIGAAVMALGGLLACFGLRWGAGLAGGAGLALAGWSALSIGLAELPIAIAQSITRTSTGEPFTLRVTRDLGWWLILGVGVVGALVFIASLRSIGTGGKAALNPLIAAVTAVAAVVLAFGPLVPVNGAWGDNFRSVDPTRDLPAAFFSGRLAQVGLIAFAGVLGMLIVRSFGIGLAVGSVSVSVWLWVSSLGEVGSNPVGIAYRNPGAETTVPHAVTTVGMVATLTLLLIAAALATHRLNRAR